MAVYANEDGTIKNLATDGLQVLIKSYFVDASTTEQVLDTYDVTPKCIMIFSDTFACSAQAAWSPFSIGQTDATLIIPNASDDAMPTGAISSYVYATIKVKDGQITGVHWRSQYQNSFHLSGTVVIFY